MSVYMYFQKRTISDGLFNTLVLYCVTGHLLQLHNVSLSQVWDFSWKINCYNKHMATMSTVMLIIHVATMHVVEVWTRLHLGARFRGKMDQISSKWGQIQYFLRSYLISIN